MRASRLALVLCSVVFPPVLLGQDRDLSVAEIFATLQVDAGERSSLSRSSRRKYNVIQEDGTYLVVSPSGGFNNQAICLFSAIQLAKESGRQLIVPMVSRHTNVFTNYLKQPSKEMVPMDEILDLDFLEKESGVNLIPLDVALEDFMQKMDASKLKIIEHPSFLGKKMKELQPYVEELKNSEISIIWFYGRFFSYHWLRHEVWSRMRFAWMLHEYAKLISEEIFKNNFNFIHIRLGDIEAEALLKEHDAKHFVSAAGEMAMDPKLPVYVATEASPLHSFFKPLYDHFETVVFAADLLSNSKIRKDVLEDLKLRVPRSPIAQDIFGNLEQLLAVRAVKFLGKSESTFTKSITIMRRNLGQSLLDQDDERERMTASISVHNKLTFWEEGSEKWFMKVNQVDDGPNLHRNYLLSTEEEEPR